MLLPITAAHTVLPAGPFGLYEPSCLLPTHCITALPQYSNQPLISPSLKSYDPTGDRPIFLPLHVAP